MNAFWLLQKNTNEKFSLQDILGGRPILMPLWTLNQYYYLFIYLFLFKLRNTHEIYKLSETSSPLYFQERDIPQGQSTPFRSSFKRKLSFWEFLYNSLKVLIIIFYEAKRDFLRKIYIALF